MLWAVFTLIAAAALILCPTVSAAGPGTQAVQAQPAAPQRQNAGAKKLVVRLPGKVRQVKIEVEITNGE